MRWLLFGSFLMLGLQLTQAYTAYTAPRPAAYTAPRPAAYTAPRPAAYTARPAAYTEVLGCFTNTPEHGIAGNFKPIAEMYGVTVYECLLFCIKSQGNSVGSLCNSVIYHKAEWSCSIYVETGMGPDGFPVPAYGHDHYLRSEFEGIVCASPTNPVNKTLPPQAICETWEFPIYGLFLGESVISGPTDVVHTYASTAVECTDGCTNNAILARVAGTTNDLPIACAGIVFTPSTGTCEYHSQDAAPIGPNQLIKSSASVYSQKFCMPLDIEAICLPEVPLFPVYNDRRPASGLIQNVSVSSAVDCLAYCARRSDCLSITWTVTSSSVPTAILNCALWSKTLSSPTDGVATPFGHKVVYIEEGCKEIILETPSQCSTGQLPAYFVAAGQTPSFDGTGSDDGQTIPNVSAAECATICSQNQVTDGTTVACASTSYDAINQICTIYSQKAAPSGPGTLLPNANLIYSEKFCLPPSDETPCVNNVFFMDVNLAVTGLTPFDSSAQKSAEACMQSCITSSCNAAQYTPTASGNNCLLFNESPSSTAITAIAGSYLFANGCLLPRRNRRRQNAAVERQIEERELNFDNVQQLFADDYDKEIDNFLFVTSTEEPTTTKVAVTKGIKHDKATTEKPKRATRQRRLFTTPDPSIDDDSWSVWTPCQFVVDGQRVRARTRQCNIFDCPPGSLQVQKCVF